MNNRSKRNFASWLFMLVFIIKMVISVIPAFSLFNAKVAASVLLQLEQETKAEKDTTEKDTLKEKKDFDEQLYTAFDYQPVLIKSQQLHYLTLLLLVPPYLRAVPTPPPNA